MSLPGAHPSLPTRHLAARGAPVAAAARAAGARAPVPGALRLAVHAVSESFAAAWPELAAEAGLSLDVRTATADGHVADHGAPAVALVAAGGEEGALPAVVRRVSSGEAEVAAVGALACHRTAVAAVRAGAADYFALPDDLGRLRAWLAERAERARARARQLAFADGEARKYHFDGILGHSPSLMRALALAARVIPHPNVTVLVTGDTGTGKELLARAVHYNGPRRTAAFVDINCAALPETLLESELFGHEKGAFTDASASKPGLFELADGGTLFLDEIGHLALPLQAKLLRALQERQIRRVGGTRSIAVDVRVVAATHVDLTAAVRAGTFREDLYYRLNVVPIALPPLRERRDDVPLLARHFLAKFAAEYGVPVPTLTPLADRAIRERDWPGNIRELRNAMERAVLLGSGPCVDAADLDAPPAPGTAAGGALPFPAPLGDIVRAAVRQTVERCGGNKSEAARRLAISRPRLQRILDGADEDGAAGE